MVLAIEWWLNSTTIPQNAVGVSTGQPARITIPGLRVVVVLSEGVCAYDSLAGNRNVYTNINKPGGDFPNTGNYLINENLGTRSTVMACLLNQSGTFAKKQYSVSVGGYQHFYGVRQGSSPNEPFGVVMLAMNSTM
jgi:hypothetical protein